MPKSDASKAGKKAAKAALREAVGNVTPITAAPSSRYSVTAWAAAQDETNLHDLVVPSGQLVQVRHVGPTGLIKMGLLDSLDILGALVQTEHVDRAAGRKPRKLSAAQQKAEIDKQMADVMSDPSKLERAMDMMDKVCVGVVNQPKVHAVPVPREPKPEEIVEGVELADGGLYLPPRIKGLVYVDSIDLEDKAFILNFVMGAVNDLEDFRQGLAENMAAVESEQDVQVPAVSSPRRKRPARSVPAE